MDEAQLNALVGSINPMSEESPYLRALIYGDEGTGKTTFVSGFGDNILFVDSADGWVTLLDHPNILNKKIERAPFLGLSQLDALATAIEEGVEQLKWVETIILDELSSMAVADLDVVLKARAAKDSDKDPNVPTQPDYLHNTERVRRTMNKIMSLPVHVIMTAHVREDKDERTGRVYTRPAFTPKTRKTLTQRCHIVGRLTSDMQTSEDGEDTTYVWRLQVRPTTGIVAKTRIKDLPMIVENPDLNVMLSGWKNRLLPDSALDNDEYEIVPTPDAPITESELSDEPTVNLGE